MLKISLLTILYNVCSDIAHYTLLFRTLVDFLQLLYRAYSDYTV